MGKVFENVVFRNHRRRIDEIKTCNAWKKLREIAALEGLVAIGYERKFNEYRFETVLSLITKLVECIKCCTCLTLHQLFTLVPLQ
jgi:hypothetical protein